MLYCAGLFSVHVKVNIGGAKAATDKVTACNRGKRSGNR